MHNLLVTNPLEEYNRDKLNKGGKMEEPERFIIVDVFDWGEVEVMKASGQIVLEDVKTTTFNLIDEEQVYMAIREENGRVTSTIINYSSFMLCAKKLIEERETMEEEL